MTDAKKDRAVFRFILAAFLFSTAMAQSSPDAHQIKLSVIVTDRQGRPAQGLREDAFQVFEEGKRQQITFFSAQETALSYGLLIDSSGSMRPAIKEAIEATILMLNKNKTGDETFIATMSETSPLKPGSNPITKPYTPTILLGWTQDKIRLLGSTVGLAARGRTPLLDSIYYCVEQAGKWKTDENQSRRRRAIVVITDGLEKDSYYKLDEFFNLTKKFDVQIFALGLMEKNSPDNQWVFQRSEREKAALFLKKMTAETGGFAFFPRAMDEVRDVAARIAELMRSQYVIGYAPPQGKKDYRKVRVAVKADDKLAVTTRPGYTLNQSANNREKR
ncbi:MAG: VWA domain-containing protein [Acidobacteriota bacterium]